MTKQNMRLIPFAEAGILMIFLLFLGYCAHAQNNQVNLVDSIVSRLAENPDWNRTTEQIKSRYGQQRTDSIMLIVKATHFYQKKDYNQYMNNNIQYVKKFGDVKSPNAKNEIAWQIFEFASDESDIDFGLMMMKEALEIEPTNAYYLDTYACLLYKSGEASQAMEVQKAAIIKGGWKDPEIVGHLAKMMEGRAIWKYRDTPARNYRGSEGSWPEVRRKFVREMDSVFWKVQLSELRAGANREEYVNALFKYVNEFKPYRNSSTLNGHAWSVFQFSDEKALLADALRWSDESLKDETYTSFRYAFLDTNANLLYKLGRKKEAIANEEKALSLCPDKERPAFQRTLEKMNKGEKTW